MRLAAIDFTTVEVWTKGGLVTFYLMFTMELETRRVHFAGCTTNPNEAGMEQAACELTNFEDNHRCVDLDELLQQAHDWFQTNNKSYFDVRNSFATAA